MLRPNGWLAECKMHIASDLWPLRADQDQLLLAILNFPSNARDALMPKGGVLDDRCAQRAKRNGLG